MIVIAVVVNVIIFIPFFIISNKYRKIGKELKAQYKYPKSDRLWKKFQVRLQRIYGNDTIKKQFGTKIVECYNRVGKRIDLSEIGHIYDYRSDLLHGNFKEAKKDLNKLKKEEYFINMFNNFYSENVDFSNADALDILRIRTREILSIIYKLHCTDFTFIKELKKKIID